MRVVLLGATGKVGALVLDELMDRGHEVTAFVRDGSKLPDASPSPRPRIWDPFDGEFVTNAARGDDVVVCSTAKRAAAQSERAPVTVIRTVRRGCRRDRHPSPGWRWGGKPAEGYGHRGRGHTWLPQGRQEVFSRRSRGAALPDPQRPSRTRWTMVSPPTSIEIGGPRTGDYRIGDEDLILDADGTAESRRPTSRSRSSTRCRTPSIHAPGSRSLTEYPDI